MARTNPKQKRIESISMRKVALCSRNASVTSACFMITQLPSFAVALCLLFGLNNALPHPHAVRNSATKVTRAKPNPACFRSKIFASPLDSTPDTNIPSLKDRKKQGPISVESYTDHWDCLLLEEHELALAEWRDRRSKCSLETLEKRGLALSRAYALPDSEVLGEKTVRIHNGSSGGKPGMQTDGILNDKNSTTKQINGRFRRLWSEIFSKGDIVMMTGNGNASFDSVLGRSGFSSSKEFRRECLIMDVGDSWMVVGVGKSWPTGVWESRKSFNGGKRKGMGGSSYLGIPVRIDKTPNAAALIPLRAQRSALQTIREDHSGGMIATWLTKTTTTHCKGYFQIRNRKRWAKKSPNHFRQRNSQKLQNDNDNYDNNSIESRLQEAIQRVTKRKSLQPPSACKAKNWSATVNDSQREAIVWALSRRVSSIQGPPGTGKTRVAALLIATALEMGQHKPPSIAERNDLISDNSRPFRILAVAHSNGAADVLLKALLDLGVPAVRAGRPAAISASVRHRSAVALAEKMPQVTLLREQLSDSRNINNKSNLEWELQQCIENAHDALLDSAPVIVASCIGAHQLSVQHDKLRDKENERRQQMGEGQKDSVSTNAMHDNHIHARFPLVVLDEAAQCTEPALLCALVAAQAEQLVMIGDTKQLPPTVASSSKQLRESLGISPMERLENSGLVEHKTLQIQYRMVQALLEHPSKYFYNGMVKSAIEPSREEETASNQSLAMRAFTAANDPPIGFDWPNPSLPLAFVNAGKGSAEVIHDSSLGLAGRSNPSEAKLVAQIVVNILEAGELELSQICVLTPYSKQVSVIRSTLENECIIRRHKNDSSDRTLDDMLSSDSSDPTLSALSQSAATATSISKVRVGTVDSFQGQEAEAVVFSAVRSNAFSELGFLRDPRRLCVALTRARQGLIIVGDSTVLKSCHHWKSLIESCVDRGCFVNEDHLSLIPTYEGNKDGVDENSEGITSISDTVANNIGQPNVNVDEVKEREKLSVLKPDEEFLGLFSIPNSETKKAT